MEERSDLIDMKALLEEKLGYPLPVSLEEWIVYNHYEQLDPSLCQELYEQELEFIKSLDGVTVRDIAKQRIREFTAALKAYM